MINEKSQGPINLTNHWRKRLWISLQVDLKRLNWTLTLKQSPRCCHDMSARRKRVISTKEIQFNHNPAKMLLTEKEGGQPKWPNPKYNWDLLILCTGWASIWAMSNTAPSRADPVVVFPLGRGCPPQETSQSHPPSHYNESSLLRLLHWQVVNHIDITIGRKMY